MNNIQVNSCHTQLGQYWVSLVGSALGLAKICKISKTISVPTTPCGYSKLVSEKTSKYMADIKNVWKNLKITNSAIFHIFSCFEQGYYKSFRAGPYCVGLIICLGTLSKGLKLFFFFLQILSNPNLVWIITQVWVSVWVSYDMMKGGQEARFTIVGQSD